MTDDISDLDALLNDGDGNFSTIDPKIIEMAGKIATALMSGGSEAFGVLLGRGVIHTEGETVYCPPADATGEIGDKAVISTIKWTGDNNGQLHLVLPELAAKGIVSYMMAMMMGTEAVPEETLLDEEGMDALKEAINNFLGSASQVLRSELGGTLTLAAESTRVVDFSASPPEVELGTDDQLCHSGQITIEGMMPQNFQLIMEVSVTGMSAEIAEREGLGEESTIPKDGETGKAENVDLKAEHAMKLKVPISVELATKSVRMEIIQSLSPGSIIEFKKLSGELLDICVGSVKIAEGEVVTTNQHFGIQIRKMTDVRATLPV